MIQTDICNFDFVILTCEPVYNSQDLLSFKDSYATAFTVVDFTIVKNKIFLDNEISYFKPISNVKLSLYEWMNTLVFEDEEKNVLFSNLVNIILNSDNRNIFNLINKLNKLFPLIKLIKPNKPK